MPSTIAQRHIKRATRALVDAVGGGHGGNEYKVLPGPRVDAAGERGRIELLLVLHEAGVTRFRTQSLERLDDLRPVGRVDGT